MSYFWWLAKMAWGFCALAKWMALYGVSVRAISISLLVLLLSALAFNFYKRTLRLSGLLIALTPLLCVVFILACGAAFAVQRSFVWLPKAGFWACVLMVIAAIVFTKGMRLSAAAVGLCILWYALWAKFVAIMSIADNWL